jgi:hypothetical protein
VVQDNIHQRRKHNSERWEESINVKAIHLTLFSFSGLARLENALKQAAQL